MSLFYRGVLFRYDDNDDNDDVQDNDDADDHRMRLAYLNFPPAFRLGILWLEEPSQLPPQAYRDYLSACFFYVDAESLWYLFAVFTTLNCCAFVYA